MKFYWFKGVYGWNMTGFVGEGGKWFIGFSKNCVSDGSGECNET